MAPDSSRSIKSASPDLPRLVAALGAALFRRVFRRS
jgi:hypothetical protein